MCGGSFPSDGHGKVARSERFGSIAAESYVHGKGQHACRRHEKGLDALHIRTLSESAHKFRGSRLAKGAQRTLTVSPADGLLGKAVNFVLKNSNHSLSMPQNKRRGNIPFPLHRRSSDGEDLGCVVIELGETGNAGNGCALKLFVDESVILNGNIARSDHFKGVIAVKTDKLALGNAVAADKLCAPGRTGLAGTDEVQTGERILELGGRKAAAA